MATRPGTVRVGWRFRARFPKFGGPVLVTVFERRFELPVSPDVLLAYAATVLVVVVSPGPSVLLVSSHRMRYGARATVPTIAGDLSANVCQMTVASLGLVTLVQQSAGMLSAIKWVGVAYLVLLGVQRLTARAPVSAKPVGAGAATASALFLRGFGVSAANPKAVVFFASLFPLFMTSGRPWLPQLAVLGSVFLVLDGTTLAAYARLGGAVRAWLQRRGRQHWESRISGSLLIGAGLALGAKRLD